MLEYIIKVTLSTLYIAIPASLLWTFAGGIQGARGSRYAKRGAIAGLLAAAVYAILKRNTGFMVREYYDLGVLLPSVAVYLVFLVVVIFSLLRRDSFSSRGGNGFIISLIFCAALLMLAYALPSVLLYPFEFAVGMDNIFNTEFMFKVLGYAVGILLVSMTGLALSRVAAALSARALAFVFGLSLAVLSIKEILAIIQKLLGRRLIPDYKWLKSAAMWSASRENLFLYALMAIAFVASLTCLMCVAASSPTGSNPAQVRRSRFLARKQIKLCVSSVFGILLLLSVMTVGVSYANRRIELSPPVEYPATGEEIVIPLDVINDGSLHRFVHKVTRGSSSVDVRYIVIRKNETAYGVGLDACDVCGAAGYYQRGGDVICIQCDVVMNKNTIGLPGGCNPVPLKFVIIDGGLTIKISDLAAEVRRF
jgi:uncharacterized membrane protein